MVTKLIVFIFNILLSCIFCSIVSAEEMNWNIMKSGTDNNLNSVWGFSTGDELDVYTVGENGTIAHYTQNELRDNQQELKWTPMQSNTTEDLNSICGYSSKNVFAVGDYGTILHYNGNGSEWESMISGVDYNLYDIYCDNNTIYAVGELATILTCTLENNICKQWNIVECNTISTLLAAGGTKTITSANGDTNDNIILIAGTNGELLSLINNESNFLTYTTYNNLNDIWGGLNNVFIVGDNGTFLSYTITENTENEKVGDNGTSRSYTITENELKMDCTLNDDINAVWGFNTDNIYSVSSRGEIIHTNKNYCIRQKIIDETLNDIWGYDNEEILFVVGDDGIIFNHFPEFKLSTENETITEGESVSLTIDILFPQNKDFSIDLTSNLNSEISMPDQVTIIQGTTSLAFKITINENISFEADRALSIKAAHPDWYTGFCTIRLIDNEIKKIDLKVLDNNTEIRNIDEGAGILESAGKLSINGELNENLTIFLESNYDNIISMPLKVTIEQGYTNTSFLIQIYDDISEPLITSSPQQAAITASAAGWECGIYTLTINDNEPRELSIIFDTAYISEASGIAITKVDKFYELSENVGSVKPVILSVPGKLINESLDITLTTSNENIIPSQKITIPQNEKSVPFNLTIFDDSDDPLIGDNIVSICANAPGWVSDAVQIKVIDDEEKEIKINMNLSEVNENAGIVHGYSLSIPGKLIHEKLEIELTTSNENIIPSQKITIPINEKSVPFNLTIIDDIENPLIGDNIVSIYANSPGWISDTAQIKVIDNEEKEIKINMILSEVYENAGIVQGYSLSVPGKLIHEKLEIELTTSKDIIIPSQKITIPINEKSVPFNLTIIDDTVDPSIGDNIIYIYADSPGWISDTTQIKVIDDEKKEIKINMILTEVYENAGIVHGYSLSVPGKLMHESLDITLTTSNENIIPSQKITIPQNEKSVPFNLTIIDDITNPLIGDNIVSIFANSPGWISDTAQIKVMDNEEKQITIEMKETEVYENIGSEYGGMLSITGKLIHDPLEIELNSNNNNIIASQKITIPLNEKSVSFNLTIFDDIENPLIGDHIVSIYANSPGWISDNIQIKVIDSEEKKITINMDVFEFYENSEIVNGGFLSVPGVLIYDPLEIELNSNNNNIIVSQKITIPINEKLTPFNLTIIDDIANPLIGDNIVSIYANSPGWTSDNIQIKIIDNEEKKITINMKVSEVYENTGIVYGGLLSITGKLIHDPLEIELTTINENIIPSQKITIPINEKSVPFNLTIIDDKANPLIGDNIVSIYANSPGWISDTTQMKVIDNEAKEIKINMKASEVYENIGSVYGGVLQIPGKLIYEPLEIELTTNNENIIPSQKITIPQNEKSVPFNLTIIDDIENPLIGDNIVSIYANSPGWISDTVQIKVIDNEEKEIKFNMKISEIYENSGSVYGGLLSIPGILIHEPLELELNTNNNNLIASQKITIPINEKSVPFNLTIIDDIKNPLIGDNIVYIYVNSPGWISDTTQINVIDNEKKEIKINMIVSEIYENSGIVYGGFLSIPGKLIHESLEIELTTSNENVIPSQKITIPINEKSVPFNLTIIDDIENPLIGDRIVSIYANSQGWISDTSQIKVIDSEEKEIKINMIVSKVYENTGRVNAGFLSIPGKLINQTLEIEISTSNYDIIPSQIITIPQNEKSVPFSLTIIDDIENPLIGDNIIFIYAESPGCISDNAQIRVIDNEEKEITINMTISEVYENIGSVKGGLLSIPGKLIHEPLEIELTTNNDNIIASQKITIPQNEKSVPFNLTIIDDIENPLIGDNVVNIYANSPGWISDTAQITVVDNEEKEIEINMIVSEVYENSGNVHVGYLSIPGKLIHEPLEIELTTSNDNIIPSQKVTIPLNEKLVHFNLTIIDDIVNPILEKDKVIYITAGASADWKPFASQILIKDNEPKIISIQLPNSVNEGMGLLKNQGMAFVPAILDYNLEINFAVESDLVTIQKLVQINKGYTCTYFDLYIEDDSIIQSIQYVKVKAESETYIPGEIYITIFDNDTADIDDSKMIDLHDIISGLKIIAGIDNKANYDSEISSDGRIGFEEILFLMNRLSRNNYFCDIDGNNRIDLQDSIIAFKILTGQNSGVIYPDSFINNKTMTIKELIYIIKKIADD